MEHVYSQSLITALSIPRRLAAISYTVWLIAEGVIIGAHSPALSSFTFVPGVPLAMDVSIGYFLSSALVLLALHSHLGGDTARRIFTAIRVTHHLGVVTMTLLSLLFSNNTYISSWFWFRVTLLCCCLVVELAPEALKTGEIVTLVEEDVLSDDMIALRDFLRAHREEYEDDDSDA